MRTLQLSDFSDLKLGVLNGDLLYVQHTCPVCGDNASGCDHGPATMIAHLQAQQPDTARTNVVAARPDSVFANPNRTFDLMIGQLDRMLSEFLHVVRTTDFDEPDRQTLKHHADDLIGVGKAALEALT